MNWESDVFDEMQLVYEKAKKDEMIERMLVDLEKMALSEAKEHCDFLQENGKPISKDRFLSMSDLDKEKIIYHLSNMGLESMNGSLVEPVITVTFSSHIQMVLGCTMFNLLNRLEKLDGSYNIRHPKATLKIIVPVGEKKNLMKCEMLIMALYPWLSVSEESNHVIGDAVSKNESSISKPVKKSLWNKLFWKK